MFTVRLREHIQLDVGRITAQFLKFLDQVVDFVLCQGKSKLLIRCNDRVRSQTEYIDVRQHLPFPRRKHCLQLSRTFEVDTFSHAVVQH